MISKYIKSSTVKEIGKEEIVLEIVINRKAVVADLQKGLEYIIAAVQGFTETITNIANAVMVGLSDEQKKELEKEN